PSTDENSNVTASITVSQEILDLAIQGDHFVTNNPELPDTDGARGTPESHSFTSPSGSTNPEGGGGEMGLSFNDLIGSGGASSPGSGGGKGGGIGTGNGTDRGSSDGTFGDRDAAGR